MPRGRRGGGRGRGRGDSLFETGSSSDAGFGAQTTRDDSSSQAGDGASATAATSDMKICITITPDGGMVGPRNKIPNTISKSFQKIRNPTGYSWKLTPKAVKTRMWEEFTKVFTWPTNYDEAYVRELWDARAGRRYSDFISSMKSERAEGRPEWMAEEDWPGWEAYWDSEPVQKKSEIARRCRMSEPEGPGTGIVKHRGGSKSTYARALELSAERGVPIQSVMYESYCSSHINKDGTYTDEKSKRIGEEIQRLAEIARQSLDGSNESTEVDINKIYLDVVSKEEKSKKKNRLFGSGSLGDTLLSGSSLSSSSAATSHFQSQLIDHRMEEMEQELHEVREERARMLEQQRLLEERQRIQEERYEAQQRLIQQLLSSMRSDSGTPPPSS